MTHPATKAWHQSNAETEAQEAANDAAIMEMARSMGWNGTSLANLAIIIAEMAEEHDDPEWHNQPE